MEFIWRLSRSHQILGLGISEHPLLQMCRLDTPTSDNNLRFHYIEALKEYSY